MPESAQMEKAQGAFTTSSLEAVHQDGIGMEQLLAGNSEQAIRSFSNATALDPNFARAYGGMASAYGNLGKTQDAEKYAKLAMEHVDRMTERERYRVRGLYYFATSNYPKCIEEYGELVKRFPATIQHGPIAPPVIKLAQNSWKRSRPPNVQSKLSHEARCNGWCCRFTARTVGISVPANARRRRR